MKGYKAFDINLRCRGFQYEVGEKYESNEKPICCERGSHFCKNASDVFNYYAFDKEKTRVCEVEAYGDIDKTNDETKYATNKIKIVREISWEEVLTLCNTGIGNTGLNNSGNCNSGNCNSGNCNSGNRNSGNRNSGDCNSGNYNSGDCNSGNYNSGYYNSGINNNGVFCTGEPKIMLFNKPSNMTLQEFYYTEAYEIMSRNFVLTKWVYSYEMTDEEKEKHTEYKTAGGYLKTFTYKEAWGNVWKNLSDEEKDIVKALPNFDAEIFKECTGIEVTC